MRLTILSFTICTIAALSLTGCLSGGGSGGSSNYAGAGSYSQDGGSSGDSYSGGTGGGGGSVVGNNPEPATLALLGSGLVAYALIRRKKNKK